MSRRKVRGSSRIARSTGPKFDPIEAPSREIPKPVIEFTSFSGPLPSPDILKKYQEVRPDLADLAIEVSTKLVEMAISQGKHRQDLETVVVNGGVAAQRRGQWMAFVLAILILGMGGFLLWNGKQIEGLGTVIAGMATLAAVFVAGRVQARNERRDRLEILTDRLGKPR